MAVTFTLPQNKGIISLDAVYRSTSRFSADLESSANFGLTLPFPCQNLTATGGILQATFTWTPTSPSSPTSYKLYRGATNIYSGTALSYVDNTTAGTYTYTIKAVYGTTESSGISKEVTIANVNPVRTLTAVGSSIKIDLSWQAPLNQTTTGYKIKRDGTVIVASQTALSYSDTSAASQTDYTYEVIAMINSAESAPVSVVGRRAGGSGTVGDPYLIYNVQGLCDMRDFYNTCSVSPACLYWRLEADLDLSAYATGVGWIPIGDYSITGSYYRNFNGCFDGNYHKISNMTITTGNTEVACVGLFGYMRNGGIVKNLGVVNCNILRQISDQTYSYIGGVCGIMNDNSVVQKCFCTGQISTGTIPRNATAYVGGLIGYGMGTTNCYSRVSITSLVENVGGFAAFMRVSSIINCYSTGSVGSTKAGFLKNGSSINAYYCYWDTQTSGSTISFAGTGKTTAEMKTQSTFTDWDFTNIWGINSNINDGYPYLRGFTY